MICHPIVVYARPLPCHLSQHYRNVEHVDGRIKLQIELKSTARKCKKCQQMSLDPFGSLDVVL